MTYQVIIPVLVAFAITAVLGPVIIPFLRKLKTQKEKNWNLIRRKTGPRPWVVL